MNPGYFTLFKVRNFYPLFTEQLTCNTENGKIMAVALEKKKKKG